MAGSADNNIATSITNIMLTKNKDGSLKYSKLERRDFGVWCVLNLGLPVTPEIQPVMLEFMAQFEMPEETTDQEAAAAVENYFKENPLNEDLVGAIASWGRKEMLSGEHGYKDRGEQLAALRQVGKADPLSAPEDKPQPKKPKVKSGLK
ncbi:MAG: hypothetical protein ABIJ09_13780 [Pseudomonadota bacterium]